MTNYLQTDPRWANLIYQSGLTYKSYACFITSLGNMVGLDPVTTAKKLIAGGGLVGGLIVSDKAASILGLEYHGVSKTQPSYPCIAQTNYFDKSATKETETHFFIINPDGSQIDPLGKSIKYPIVNYRLFKGDFMSYDLFQQKGKPEVYERHSDYSLVHLTYEDYIHQYTNPVVNQVDDINSAGHIIPQTVEVPVEKIVEKPVEVIKEVPVEKIVYVDRPVIVEKEIVRTPTWGELVNLIWDKIKNRRIND